MIHSNRDEFIKVLERTAAQTGFPLLLLEKDYFITLILSGINKLSDSLIFKGGTCLSKIYYSYYRISEDIDFSLKLPAGEVSRTVRKKAIKPVKEKLMPYVKNLSMEVANIAEAGHNESTQYSFYLNYDSAVLNGKQSLKLEIGMRSNPILPVSKQNIKHKFLHPFTKAPLFDGGIVNCLSLKELVAEKMRAAATRITIVPRDFYDLGYLIRAGFNFRDPELLRIFKMKLAEDGFGTDIRKYCINLGRSDKEIDDMCSRIEEELLDVLTREEKKKVNLTETIEALNKAFKI